TGQDDEEAPAAVSKESRRVVQNTSSPRRGLATSHSQRETPRPLPVLRTAHELPQPVAVLSGRPADLEEVARPEDAGKDAYLGKVREASASPPASATPDHTSLGRNSESYLRNPLGEFRAVGSVRGEDSQSATSYLHGHAAGTCGLSQGTPTVTCVVLSFSAQGAWSRSAASPHRTG